MTRQLVWILQESSRQIGELQHTLLSGNPVDEEIGAETSGDITKPENGIRSILSRETRSRRWEKLRKNASSENEGTPDGVIVDELRNKPSTTQGSAGKIHSSVAT